MAPYLATATLGKFDLTISQVERDPVVRRRRPAAREGPVLSKLPEVVELLRVDLRPVSVQRGRRDRRQREGRRLLARDADEADLRPHADEATLVHELSHMWFGDSVTLTTWPDIWLHEGFATWSEWIWSEHQGNKSAHQWFEQLYNTPRRTRRSGAAAAATPAMPALPVQRHDLLPRRDDAAGAAREDRRPRVLPAAARLGARRTATATSRRRSSSRSPSRTAGWT